MVSHPKAVKSLQVAFWNCNGLNANRNELETFAQQHDLDVIMLSETHLNDNHRDPLLVGYSIYRTDRQLRRGGGTAIYVRKSVKHCAAPVGGLRSLEATGVIIDTSRGPIQLVSVYNTPDNVLDADDLNIVFNSSPRLLIAGDLNAKHTQWGSRRANRSGQILSAFVLENNFMISAPSEPTYHNPRNDLGEFLDIAVSKDIPFQIRVTTLNELSSDHEPVLMHIGGGANEPFIRELKKVNWSKFSVNLQSRLGPPTPIDSTVKVDEAVEALELNINNARNACTRVIKISSKFHMLPRHLSDLIREKNRIRRRVRRWAFPADKQELNRLKNEVRYALQDYRNERWQERVEELSTENNSLWKMAKALRSQRTHMPPLHTRHRGVVYTDDDKAEGLADELERQCRPNDERFDDGRADDSNESISSENSDDLDDHIEEVEDTVQDFLENDDDSVVELTTQEEIRDLLSTVKIRKASGPDEISNRELKFLPVNAILALTAIINAILSLRYFPTRWKSANVIFILKKGESSKFPENYRPISLLCTLGKIAERVIHKRLSRLASDLGIIPDEQMGFRREHSTIHQLLRVTEFASTSLNWRNVTGAVFLDVSKAFDSVWHEGLIFKLISYGIPPAMVKLIHSFITARSFRARVENSLSTVRPIEAGVPQGSVLSPLLYNLFTADIPRPVNATLAIYADDTAILCRSKSATLVTRYLQRTLDELEAWLRLWRIVLNPAKSNAMLITRRLVRPVGQLSLRSGHIPWRDEVKYLGVTFDKTLRFNTHITNMITKAKRIGGFLSPLTGRRSLMSMDNKLLLYKSIIRPSMTYASVVWGHACFTSIHKLQVIQNKFLRHAFNAPWFVRNQQLHFEAEMKTIHEFLLDQADKFFASVPDHPNRLVRDAADYDERAPSRVRRPKMALLQTPDEIMARAFPNHDENPPPDPTGHP